MEVEVFGNIIIHGRYQEGLDQSRIRDTVLNDYGLRTLWTVAAPSTPLPHTKTEVTSMEWWRLQSITHVPTDHAIKPVDKTTRHRMSAICHSLTCRLICASATAIRRRSGKYLDKKNRRLSFNTCRLSIQSASVRSMPGFLFQCSRQPHRQQTIALPTRGFTGSSPSPASGVHA